MIIAVALVLAATTAFGLATPAIGRRARPLLAVGVLVGGGAAVTSFCILALGAIVATAAGRIPMVARLGDWSSAIIEQRTPVSPWWAVVAAAVLVLAAINGGRAATSTIRSLLRAWSAARTGPGPLVVLADDRPMAYAVPGWPGRIVATNALLRRLDAGGRRAVLSHERAHLAERHDLLLLAGSVLAGANPLLRRLPAALSLACERRADEVAAAAVGDRRAVARAITLAVRPELADQLLLPAGGEVVERVESLLREPHRSRGWSFVHMLLPAVVILVGAVALLVVAQDLDRLLDAAALLRR
ncbi:MAG TPA: M56 family metallopeptidase [Mycobacteriales bacterium]